MAKFILFDIDGTLIDSAGAGKRALEAAFTEVTAVENGFEGVVWAGNTDLQILRQGLTDAGVDDLDRHIDLVIAGYLDRLESEMATANGHVKPGVNDLLVALEDDESCILGLLTGNMRHGAGIKLNYFDLLPFFPVGAYGDDHPDRNRLLPVAVQRLREETGVSMDHEDCIIVGDTPRDVDAAAEHGAKCIGVATGPFSPTELDAAGADLTPADLSDTRMILEWIGDQ